MPLCQIYPGPDLELASGELLSLLNDVEPNAWGTSVRNALAGGDENNNVDINSQNDGTWPFNLTVVNDAVNDEVSIRWENGNRVAEAKLSSAFTPEADLYFGYHTDRGSGEGFEIYNIDIVVPTRAQCAADDMHGVVWQQLVCNLSSVHRCTHCVPCPFRI